LADWLLLRAAIRRLRAERIEQAVLLYLDGAGSAEAADLARVPRAEFLDLLASKGVALLDAPSSIPEELEAMGKMLGDDRLTDVAHLLRGRERAAETTPAPSGRSTSRRRRP
jgi:hypothetical protein